MQSRVWDETSPLRQLLVVSFVSFFVFRCAEPSAATCMTDAAAAALKRRDAGQNYRQKEYGE